MWSGRMEGGQTSSSRVEKPSGVNLLCQRAKETGQAVKTRGMVSAVSGRHRAQWRLAAQGRSASR
jgi:hypothetical protein